MIIIVDDYSWHEYFGVKTRNRTFQQAHHDDGTTQTTTAKILGVVRYVVGCYEPINSNTTIWYNYSRKTQDEESLPGNLV